MARSISVITKDIKEIEGKLSESIKVAKSLHAQLGGYVKVVETRAIDRCNVALDAFLQKCSIDEDPLPFNWSANDWDGFQPAPSASPIGLIRVGGLKESDTSPLEKAADLPSVCQLFDNNGPIVIQHDEDTINDARETLQSLTLRIALSMPGQVRFTLLDPTGMGSAFPFRGFLGREVVRNAGRSTMDELAEVLDDIRRINERVIGDASRFSDLTTEQRSGETFEVIVAADFPNAYSKDPRAVEALIKIANAGPRAGRHLVLEWNTHGKFPHDFKTDMLSSVSTIDLTKKTRHIDTPPDGTVQKALIKRAFDGSRQREGGDWNAIIRPHKFGNESAARRVSTPVGERIKFWLGESEDGKQSAHAMIAGQTGSGKSYMLHVIITGLASRYSPEELRFTLIDGKQGVEFEAYRSLPHADVVCLRSAPALARSVLADFVAEMEDRYEQFQEAGVVKLSDYREKTGKVMARRVLVVDEYQQILEGDPEAGAHLLGKLLEKGRAAGMHAVLGSQTFEQRGLPQSALTHIHSWAALSLSETYSQSLQVFGGEGKRLIRELGSTGEVVINDEGGRDGANARGAVARLRKKEGDNLLPAIITDIYNSCENKHTPTVLSGREASLVSENPYLTQPLPEYLSADALQNLARKSLRMGGFGLETWNKADHPIPLWLGRCFDVRGHALCALRRAPGQNLLSLGGDTESRHRMIAAALAVCGGFINPSSLEVTFINGLRESMPGSGMIDAALERLARAGSKIVKVDINKCDVALQKIASKINKSNPKNRTQILVVSEPDYLYDLHGGADRFSAPKQGPAVALRQILSRGPQAGVHTLFTASGLTSFQLVLSPSREASLFNHVVAQQMNEEDSMSLFSSLMGARLNERADHPFACIHVDKIAGTRNATLFHSYGANRVLGADQGLEAMREQIDHIVYPGD
ncbi:MAG: FtsK/SpoIIIE domain-containing protein [Maricaulaceae bacterium]